VKVCKPICRPSPICTATPAFLYSTDRKWIIAKYKMKTQKKEKREPRAATLDQYLSIDAILDPS
jgi:ribonuclease PH